ncbi:CU044_5270 family protein [Kitasatospora misakiensis]|uniref:CU044_5270 family protein n=1 Tax=Kitasatospora misakiensis TaxID=67330 RepID=A0ABW0WZJ5_9ACTN
MNEDILHVRAQLAPHDPAAQLTDEAIDAAKSRTRVRLAAKPGAAARPVRRRTIVSVAVTGVLALAGTAVATGLLPLPGTTAGQSYGATPHLLESTPMPSDNTLAGVLTGIADRVEQLPDASAADARYDYVRTRSWDLWTAVRERTATSAIVVQDREVWLAADGSGRLRTASVEDGSAPTASDRAAGEDSVLGAGVLSVPDQKWSTDPAVLATQLDRGHPAAAGPSERLVAVADVYRSQHIAPQLRAALLRVLAESPELQLDGTTTDRAGRTGVAISATTGTGLPRRHTLVFDPATGSLLDAEQILTSDPGKLNITVPAVVSYQLFLASGRVPTTDDRP